MANIVRRTARDGVHCEECATRLLVDATLVDSDEKNQAANAILRLLAGHGHPKPLQAAAMKILIAQQGLMPLPWDQKAIPVVLHELLEHNVITGDSPYSIHPGDSLDAGTLLYQLAISDVRPEQ